MGKSINQDVYAGGSTYHIQTEYYKSSGKIVTNIFKDGVSVKRLEKKVEEGLSDDEIDQEIEKFHFLVLEKLRQGGKKGKRPQPEPKTGQEVGVSGEERAPQPAAEAGFELPQELYEPILELINPYFGIASAFSIEEALASATGVDSFIEALTKDLEDEAKGELIIRLRELFDRAPELLKSSRVEEAQEEEAPEEFELTPEHEQKILTVLSDYFGIMATAVLEEAISDWRAIGGSYQELVDIICAHADTPEEEEELRQRLLLL